MPVLFVGPNGVIDNSMMPPALHDRLEAEAQDLANEFRVRIDVYHSQMGDDLEVAQHLGIVCKPEE